MKRRRAGRFPQTMPRRRCAGAGRLTIATFNMALLSPMPSPAEAQRVAAFVEHGFRGMGEEAEADEAELDEGEADEAELDEAEADEGEADEAEADEAELDEAEADEGEADEAELDAGREGDAGHEVPAWPDVLLLQEVWDTPLFSRSAWLGGALRTLGYRCIASSRAGPCWAPLNGGLLVASRAPFAAPPAELVFRATAGAQSLCPKGALLVRLASPPCFVCTTHFHAGDEELPCFRGRGRTARIQSSQAEELRAFLREHGALPGGPGYLGLPLVLAGDFNSDAAGELSGLPFRALCRALAPAAHLRPPPATPHTYPHPTSCPSPLVFAPHRGTRAHLDHFFLLGCAPLGLRVLAPRRGALWLSDHAPVLAAVEVSCGETWMQ
jgi:hypothetical protein